MLNRDILEGPNIRDLYFFIKYYYRPAFSKSNTIVKNEFLRNVSKLIRLIDDYYLKESNGKKYYEFLSKETPLPELMIPVYYNVIDFITLSN